MSRNPKRFVSRARPEPRLRDTVWQDIREGDVPRALRRDFRDIQRFYLDDERRHELARMRPLKRLFVRVFWLLKASLLKLSPARRLLVLAALAFLVLGETRFQWGEFSFSSDLGPWSAVILLFVLMLELKDKLLARDEIEIARQVQLALLPHEAPRLDGWSIHLFTRPANDVGGDLVDAIRLAPDQLALILGDVAGKGLGAALLAAKLQATLRALAPGHRSLDALGQQLNRIMTRDGLPNRFSTLFYLEIAAEGDEVRYLNAGHCPPFVVRGSRVDLLKPASLPLGIDAEEHFAEGRLSLAPGEALVAYSDGVTEARNAADEMFGERRIERALERLRGRGVSEIGARLVRAVDDFVADERRDDDLSLVIVARAPAGRPSSD
ncbi:MAG: SpoIIE family protein phosphatase [Acidobacteriota bacterium]|nr:MAG: SpoIIE family protein phosphatase [Acidobacteriota bacterium]